MAEYRELIAAIGGRAELDADVPAAFQAAGAPPGHAASTRADMPPG